MEKLIQTIRMYFIEIPATLVLAPVGFLMEFMVTLPLIIACELDGFLKKQV